MSWPAASTRRRRARGGYQQEATVRGHEAVLEVTPGTDPGSGIWLWWTEPGAWADETGGAAADHVFYALYALGLTPQEVLQIAASLTASAP